jgi:hypothetical protein
VPKNLPHCSYYGSEGSENHQVKWNGSRDDRLEYYCSAEFFVFKRSRASWIHEPGCECLVALMGN